MERFFTGAISTKVLDDFYAKYSKNQIIPKFNKHFPYRSSQRQKTPRKED